MRFSGCGFAITGASSGIGRATAALLGREGASVGLLGTDQARLEAAREEALSAGAPNAEIRQVDVRDLDGMAKAAESLVTALGSVDGLVHSAGINSPTSLEGTPLEVWREVIDVNLTGTFVACKAFLPAIRGSERGSIVLLSSVQSRLGGRSSQYAASKAGVEGLMRSFAREASGDEIRVNAVAPAGTETPFATKYWSEGTRERLVKDSLVGRVAEPEEVAEAIAFLLSPQSSYVTGSTLHVNGGLHVT